MTSNSTTGGATRLPLRTGRVVRSIWLILAFTTWAMSFSARPAIFQSWLSADPSIQALMAASGLPATLPAIFNSTLDLLTVVAFGLIALVLFWQRSDDWLALFVGLMLILTSYIYTGWQETGVFLWVTIFLVALGETSQVVFFFVFPSGKFIPRRAWLLIPPLFIFRFLIWTNIETNQAASQGAVEVGIVVLLMLIGIGFQVHRFRRLSTPAQRQQTKWLLAGMMVTVPVVALYIYVVDIAGALGPLSASNFFLLSGLKLLRNLALMFFPLTIGLSILRYRLWDIDLAINRSLVVGVVVVMLLIPFAVTYLVYRALFGWQVDAIQQVIAVGMAGLIVVGLFPPARRQARRFIDRRFYRLRFDLNELRRAHRIVRVENPGALTGSMLGPYEVLGVLGRGGMGEVYQGQKSGQMVAIKILPGEMAQHAELRTRFAREVEVSADLHHPNIVPILDSGETQGVRYMVMEYIEGEELEKRLARQGRLDVDQAVGLIVQVADALEHAHQQGFVHRDIKPSNIMLRLDEGCEPGCLMLMDFGVVKVQDARTITGTGAVGSIYYMAPEQMREARAVDHRADIYALGVVLYEMLTGRRPFEGNPAQVMFAHLQQPPPDPRDVDPEIPPHIAEAVLQAMAKDPDRRFQSARTFADALITPELVD
jgi:hypothetical protein